MESDDRSAILTGVEMTMTVHNFTDLVNLQTVCKSTDLQVYKFIDSDILLKYGFSFAFNIPGKMAACTKHNCCCYICFIKL